MPIYHTSVEEQGEQTKKIYGSFKKLLSQSGFGWDNVSKTVVVDDPSIWESHIKDNSEWTKFKKDGFSQYPKLCIVFGGTYATGDHAIGNAKDLTVSEEGDNGGGNVDGDPEDLSDHHIDETVFTSGNSADLVHDKHKLDRTPNTKRRRKNTSFCIADTCKVIQELIKTKTSQSASGSATSRITQPPVDPFSISAVIDSLLSMPDLGPNLYSKAVERHVLVPHRGRLSSKLQLNGKMHFFNLFSRCWEM
ncbi:uncharacterized protein LOC130135546 [Syzygium oleosum]|uniref:uncharacterized protein LOC130135546 n=1 Tax=Syzygium oleosum TaxID=219896 RepID=UPI0024B9FD14|nr:uncharacterized protein LOC130135546 [Syzygium oleosum]